MKEQILVCYDGSDDGERAVAMAAALLGPQDAVVERGSVSHDEARHARRAMLVVPTVTA